MARIGSAKRVDPKAKGTAFRKAHKRPREDDDERESRRRGTNGKSLKQKASPSKKQDKNAIDPSERSRPNQAKPFKGNKVAQKSTKRSPDSKTPLKKARIDQSKPRNVAKEKGRSTSQQESNAKIPTRSPLRPSDAPGLSRSKSKPSKNVKKEVNIPDSNGPQRGMRIVVGSYERFLYGLAAFMRVTQEGGYECVIEPQFVFPAHVASIRAVACAGDGAKWLCTGGTDETIKVWDLRRKKEVGALIGHEGTITTLCFPSRTIMMSAGEDGLINMYRVRDWSLLRTLRGHTGRINSASVHPSGRIALSVGADRMIRMWDLMRGVGASSVKIGVAADRIEWDTQGKRFAVMAGSQVMLFATDLTKLGEIDQPKRLHDLCFTQVKMADGKQHELLCVACETGVVNIYDLNNLQAPTDDETDSMPSPKEIGQLVGHENRVRSVQVVPVAAEDGTISLLATTISSDGWIRVFNMTPFTATEEFLELESIASYDTKHSRLTCLSAVGFDPEATAAEIDEDTEIIDQSQSLDVDSDLLLSESEAEVDEDSEEELARLEKEVKQAREAGVVVDEEGNIVLEGDNDADHDDDQDTDSSAQSNDLSDSQLESEEEQEEEQEEDA